MSIVAGYLKAPASEARHLSRVCHLWYAVFSPTVWHKCCVDDAFVNDEAAIQGLIKNASHIRHLTYFDLAVLSRLRPPCTQLTDLVIQHNRTSANRNEAGKWQQLVALIRENLPRLSNVSVSACTKPATTEFWSVLGSCSRVHVDRALLSAPQTRVFWEGFRSTQELSVHFVRLPKDGDFFEEARGDYPALKKLVFLGEPKATLGMIRFLVQCPNLTSLTMECSKSTEDHGVPALEALLKQGHLPQLQRLTLRGEDRHDELLSSLHAMIRLRHSACSSADLDRSQSPLGVTVQSYV